MLHSSKFLDFTPKAFLILTCNAICINLSPAPKIPTRPFCLGIVTRLRAERPRNHTSFLGRGKKVFSSLDSIQQPATYMHTYIFTLHKSKISTGGHETDHKRHRQHNTEIITRQYDNTVGLLTQRKGYFEPFLQR